MGTEESLRQLLIEARQENKNLSELEKKHYNYAIDANKRLGECKVKLDTVTKIITDFWETNLHNENNYVLCVETLGKIYDTLRPSVKTEEKE